MFTTHTALGAAAFLALVALVLALVDGDPLYMVMSAIYQGACLVIWAQAVDRKERRP